MGRSKSDLRRDGSRQGLSRFQRLALLGLAGVLVLSATLRAVLGAGGDDPSPAAGGSGPSAANGLVSSAPPSGGQPGAGGELETAPEPGSIEAFLPFFTEASFFALIGFALGYATRKVVKLALIVVAVFFAGLQGLVYAGVAEVDWGQAIELLNGLILNVKQDQTLTEILKAKVPAFGGLLGGYLLGFRRG